MARFCYVLEDSHFWRNCETQELVPYSRHQDPCFSEHFDGGDSDDPFPYPAVQEVMRTPKGGDLNWKIDLAWWNFCRELNLLYGGGEEAWYAFRHVWGGIINSAPNPEYKPDSHVPDPPDNGWPIIEGVTTSGNYHEVVGYKNGSYALKAFNYYAGPPDLSKINPKTARHLFVHFRGISNKGVLGNAPDGEFTWVPLVVKNSQDRAQDYVYVQEEKLRLDVSLPEDDNPMSELPLIRDYSKYQFPIDFGIAKTNGVRLVAMRAAISYAYKDPNFSQFWKDAEPHFPQRRTSYHVLYPGEDVTKQADNWYEAHPENDVVPRVIDMELEHDVPHEAIGEACWAMSNIVLARDGIRPLIYSRRLLIDLWLAGWTQAMLDAHWYWLAQYWLSGEEHGYATGEDLPTLPKRVGRERILLHQTTDTKPGFPGEVGSLAVDWNRWQPADDLDIFIPREFGGSVPEPPDPEPDIQEIINLALANAQMASHQAIEELKA